MCVWGYFFLISHFLSTALSQLPHLPWPRQQINQMVSFCSRWCVKRTPAASRGACANTFLFSVNTWASAAATCHNAHLAEAHNLHKSVHLLLLNTTWQPGFSSCGQSKTNRLGFFFSGLASKTAASDSSGPSCRPPWVTDRNFADRFRPDKTSTVVTQHQQPAQPTPMQNRSSILQAAQQAPEDSGRTPVCGACNKIIRWVCAATSAVTVGMHCNEIKWDRDVYNRWQTVCLQSAWLSVCRHPVSSRGEHHADFEMIIISLYTFQR